MANYVDYNNAQSVFGGYASAIKAATIQYSTMPSATEDNLGQIAQFTGETNQNYTQGFFYKCTRSGTAPSYTYSWQNIELQDSNLFIVTGTINEQGEVTALDKTPTEVLAALNASKMLFYKDGESFLSIVEYLYSNGVLTVEFSCPLLLTSPRISPSANYVFCVSYGLSSWTFISTSQVHFTSAVTWPTDEPDSTWENVIVQYIGQDTDERYKKGYFYKCVANEGSDPTTYRWEQWDVQPNYHIEQSYIDNLSTGINVKDYGAIGDNYNDDTQAFEDAMAAAITAGTNIIIVPRGTYHLYGWTHPSTTMSTAFRFIGENREKTIIKYPRFVASYGITCENITFFKGSSPLSYDSGYPSNLRGEISIIVTPEYANANITFKNCKFTDAQAALVAFHNSSSSIPIESCIIEDCIFENLDRCGVYLGCNITQLEVRNNTFRNIGNEVDTSGALVALYLGDTSNNTTQKVSNGIIENNLFDTVKTGYNLSGAVHVGISHFICCDCDDLIITNNIMKNITGYGNDKEGIYTKGTNIEICYNKIHQAGSGEAYICCKTRIDGPTPNRMMHVHHNILTGEYGEGIRIYGGGKVHDNVINIKKLRSGIKFFPYSDNTLKDIMDVENNYIYAILGTLTMGGETVTDFDPGDMVIGSLGNNSHYGKVKINNNYMTILRESGYTKYFYGSIKIQNVVCDIEINNNKMEIDGQHVVMALTYSDSVPSTDKKININIENNYCMGSTSCGVQGTTSTTNTHLFVTYTIKNNIWTSITNDVYAINLGGAANSANLYYESNEPKNLFSPKKHVYSTCNKYIYTTLDSGYFLGTGYTIVTTDFAKIPQAAADIVLASLVTAENQGV